MQPKHPLLATLPQFLPLAVRWVESRESEILANGIRMSPDQQQDARSASVAFPEKIRLRIICEIPVPSDPLLNEAAREIGLLGFATTGLALRYGIFIREDMRFNRELLIHEFVHVGQYERLGSIGAFLRSYLQECIDLGYPLGPMEQEAICTARKIVRGA